jgi:hypothetical protein
MAKKRFTIPGKIIGGSCALCVEAETKEQAIRMFLDGLWEVEKGSEDWECEIDTEEPTDGDEIARLIEG